MPLSRGETIVRAVSMLAGRDWRNILEVRDTPDDFIQCEIDDCRSLSGVTHALYRREVVNYVAAIVERHSARRDPTREQIDVIPRTYIDRYLLDSHPQERSGAMVWRLGDGNVLLIYSNCLKFVLFKFADWTVLHTFASPERVEQRGRPTIAFSTPSNSQDVNRILRERIGQLHTPDGRVTANPVEFRNTASVLESFTELYAIVWQAVGHKTCGYYKVFKNREKAKVELEAVKQRDPSRLYTMQTVPVVE